MASAAVLALVLAVWGFDPISVLTVRTPTAGLLPLAHLAWPITVLLFICVVADRAHDDHVARSLHWSHSIVLTAAGAFGGGIVAPLLCGRAQAYFAEETFMWLLLAAWLLTYRTDGRWTQLYRATPALQLLATVLFEAFRGHMIINFATMGDAAFRSDAHTKSRYFTDPDAPRILGPIICGGFAGSAGAFLLSGPSLAPLRGGLSPPVHTALVGSTAYWLAVKNLQLCDATHAKAVLACFLAYEALKKQQKDLVQPLREQLNTLLKK